MKTVILRDVPLAANERAESGEREVLAGGRVRGSMILAHLEWVRTYAGPEGESDLLAALAAEKNIPPGSGIDAEVWYPFSLLIAIDRLIYRQFGQNAGELALYEDLGRFSARIHLETVFSPWVSAQFHEFFESATELHSLFQDFGDVEYRRAGERHVLMIHSGYPCFSRVYCQSAAGYYEQCLISHGAVGFSVSEESCQCLGWSACRFDLRWR